LQLQLLRLLMESLSMKTIRMPYPLKSPASTTNAQSTNKVRIERIDGDFYIEHLLPAYEMALDASGRVIDETAQPRLAGYQSAFIHCLKQSDLEAMAQDPGNAYTVWLFAVRSGAVEPLWINKFAQTALSKDGFREYWNQQPMLVLAQLWIPPLGLEPSLVLMCSPQSDQTEVTGFDFDHAWETNSVAMVMAFPLFRLADEGGDPRRIRIMAVNDQGVVIPASGQVLLSTTAGALSNSRPSLEQGQALVTLFGADPGALAKIKLGFKWFSGVEEREVRV
jgi:hypothetical protein